MRGYMKNVPGYQKTAGLSWYFFLPDQKETADQYNNRGRHLFIESKKDIIMNGAFPAYIHQRQPMAVKIFTKTLEVAVKIVLLILSVLLVTAFKEWCVEEGIKLDTLTKVDHPAVIVKRSLITDQRRISLRKIKAEEKFSWGDIPVMSKQTNEPFLFQTF
jgi:hypothetical protein